MRPLVTTLLGLQPASRQGSRGVPHRWKRPLLKLGHPGTLLVLLLSRALCRVLSHTWIRKPWGRFCTRCWAPELD
jgi:hypothetical protein